MSVSSTSAHVTPILESSSLQELEKARAILSARLEGREMDSNCKVDEKVASAISMIAQGYQTESDEEGEVDHEQDPIPEQSIPEPEVCDLVSDSNNDVDTPQSNDGAELYVPEDTVLPTELRRSSHRSSSGHKKGKRKKRSRSRERKKHSGSGSPRRRRSRSRDHSKNGSKHRSESNQNAPPPTLRPPQDKHHSPPSRCVYLFHNKLFNCKMVRTQESAIPL